MTSKIYFRIEPKLTLFFQAFGLIFLEASSVGLALWFFIYRQRRLGYVWENNLSPRERSFVLMTMFGVGFIAILLSLFYLLWKKSDGILKLRYLSQKLLPLCFAAFAPLLFYWKLWENREFTFFAITLLITLAGQKALMASCSLSHLFSISKLISQKTSSALKKINETSLPLILVILGALGYAVFFSYHTITSHQNLRTASFDMGLENNILWNIVHGNGPALKNSPMSGPHGGQLGWHATFFAYLLGPIYALYQKSETLLVIQATLMGGAAIPFYFFAKQHVSKVMSCLLALCFVAYPPLQGANLYDFHYVVFGPFFIFLTLFLLETKRDRWAIFSIILTLSVREDVAPGLAIIGAYLLLTGRRPLAGLIVAGIGTFYFVLMKMIIMPKLAGAEVFTYMYQGLIPTGEKGFGGVLKTVIGNPSFTITSLLERDKLLYLLHLMVPLAMLPLRRPIGLLFLVPGFFFTLLSTGYAPLIQTSFQYTAHWTGYLFISTTLTLEWMGQKRFSEDHHAKLRQKTWILMVLFASLLCTYQLGAFFQKNTIRGGFGIYQFGTSADEKRRKSELDELIKLVPPMDKISSSELVVPQVSSRPDSYTLRVGIFDAEWILSRIPGELPNEREQMVRVLLDKSFGVYATRQSYALLKRGFSIDGNAQLLRKLGVTENEINEKLKIPTP